MEPLSTILVDNFVNKPSLMADEYCDYIVQNQGKPKPKPKPKPWLRSVCKILHSQLNTGKPILNIPAISFGSEGKKKKKHFRRPFCTLSFHLHSSASVNIGYHLHFSFVVFCFFPSQPRIEHLLTLNILLAFQFKLFNFLIFFYLPRSITFYPAAEW